MQLEFDKQKERLKIKDEVPSHSKLVIVLMLVNALNMGVQLFSMRYYKNEFLFILMLLLAIVSVVAVFFYLFKRSWKTNYNLSEIEGLEVKKVLGRERVFLKLHNGKKRSFTILKNENELNNLKNTLTTIGIKSI
ncbi:DUF2101 family protein [Tenacibaculum sp. HL-MS23]|uniref:DUF2101 family protein n=1 Tax=Tenacibaculum TaxID=104267 RepID=UPI001C4F81A6|nr:MULTISPECIES: DUF2101 family protein [Tenacibaculum]QXP73215.1 DUF2101 family protein [Tenacibaculum sp. AHE14PA]QXP77128.1 DUF2101 family protein [Tenacibaculum sp. AHE15PA]WNW01265.1 DUF2101 family protein [Tenacibaculum sp. HL-MS23]